jgi:hypothetical protein
MTEISRLVCHTDKPDTVFEQHREGSVPVQSSGVTLHWRFPSAHIYSFSLFGYIKDGTTKLHDGLQL